MIKTFVPLVSCSFTNTWKLITSSMACQYQCELHIQFLLFKGAFLTHILAYPLIIESCGWYSDWLRAGWPRVRSQRPPGAFSSGLKRPAREADHLPTSSTEVKNE
jgi:hypothetical protein